MTVPAAAGRRARIVTLVVGAAGALGLAAAGFGVGLLLRPYEPGWFAYAPLSGEVATGGMRPSIAGIVLLAVGAATAGGAGGYLLAVRRR